MAELYRLSFEEKIPGTKDVICPSINVLYTQEFEGSPQGKKLLEYFKKHAMIRVQKVKDKALKPYKGVIEDTQEKINVLRKQGGNLKTVNDVEAMKASLQKLEDFIKTANQLLKQGVQSIQSVIQSELLKIEKDAIEYVQKKMKLDLILKKMKKTLKVIIVGTFIIVAATVSIAATISTAGAGLALAAAVTIVAAKAANAYCDVDALIKKDWENETLTAARIRGFYKDLSKLTTDLQEQLTQLDTYHRIRKLNLEKAVIKRDLLVKEYQRILAPSPAQQKAKKAIAEGLKKSQTAVNKMGAADAKIADLLKLGQQTCQYLGPLGNASSAADGVMSAMKAGASFIVDQSKSAREIQAVLKAMG